MTHAILASVAAFGPLAAFAASMLFLMRAPNLAKALVLGAGAASLGCALALLAMGPRDPIVFEWFQAGGANLRFGYMLDGLSLVFGAVVAGVAFLVQVYSVGYMSHDPSQTRYFAMLSLFLWSMLSFVYAADLLQAFIFWELVGLASFFLIGFWYEKPSAVAAAKKAFIMTRIGDCGLFFGLLVLLHTTQTLDLAILVSPSSPLLAEGMEGHREVILLLVFLGVMGKSAQFPLHTWLPDAMEGPTPVSALLHSATMVAAGVFLFARLHPLYAATPLAMQVVLAVACLTALLAGSCAVVEPDIKKILAYSSISQLGFMLMALAAGGLFAGAFHLVTHAFFKALLFLCAGMFIHAFHTNSVVEIGIRGGRRLTPAVVGLVVGGGALAGVPPLAGFFSKEEVLAALHHASPAAFAGALLAAFVTAYYTARMVLLVVRPAAPPEVSHPHATLSMSAPVVILTAATALAGLGGRQLASYLGIAVEAHELPLMAMALSALAAGLALGWWDFGRASAPRTGLVSRLPWLESLLRNGWHLDELYRRTIVRPVWGTASALRTVESEGFDQGFDGCATRVAEGGAFSTRIQSGWVQWYVASALVMFAGLAIFLGMRG